MMSKSFRAPSPRFAGVRAALLAAASSAIVPPAVAAPPDIPEPVVELLVPGGGRDGRYDAAVSVGLPEDWHTYWRNPGDAGLPPLLDASASENLAALEVAFPAPERWTDGRTTSIVYHGGTVLPLAVTAADPSRPVDLRITMTFGFCREICVPGTADLSARLAPDAPADAAAGAAVEEARAKVPVPEAEAPAATPRIAAVERFGDDPRTAVLRIVLSGEGAAVADLFAEPPDGWYLTVPRRVDAGEGRASFELPLKGMPRKADPAGAAFRFTVVSPGGAHEALRTLD